MHICGSVEMILYGKWIKKAMKKILNTIIVAVVILISSVNRMYAVSIEDVKLAVSILKGIDDTKDDLWAIQIIKQAAIVDSIPYAMNVLGIAYMNGIAIEQDVDMACKWLELAGKGGFSNAYHNLGMIYKNGNPQDFGKAYEYFKQGVDSGSIMCCYDQGYMLYKGLGCQQNYAAAITLFEKGVAADHSPCLYMLGLCYRNGYGVEENKERAEYLLRRAANHNYGRAMEELNCEQPENSWNSLSTNLSLTEIPAMMPADLPLVIDCQNVSGKYEGVLVTYDWSGENIISERPLALDVVANYNELTGMWCEGKDTVQIKAMMSENGRMVFSESSISRRDRYVVGKPIKYRFESADLCAELGSITGRLRLYSTTIREPERPMYILLNKKDSTKETKDGAPSKIYAYPNPFSNQFTVSFDLLEKEKSALLYIYSQSGINLHTYHLTNLQEGKTVMSVSPTLPEGVFLLKVVTQKQKFQTIIIKKNNIR